MKSLFINPQKATQAKAFEHWTSTTSPTVTFFKTPSVTPLVRLSHRSGINRSLKLNTLLCRYVCKAVGKVKKFYTCLVKRKLLRYDTPLVNTIAKNKHYQTRRIC